MGCSRGTSRADAAKSARLQKLSAAVLSGSSTWRATTKPTAALRTAIRSLRASGSTTTRSTDVSAKHSSITRRITAEVKPWTGVSVGATRTCIPTSPGRSSGSPARSE